MSRTIELPESIYQGLMEAARTRGVSPADWIAEKLPATARAQASAEDIRAARERLWKHVGSIDLGRPTGTDNEHIDADLGRAYGDAHEADA